MAGCLKRTLLGLRSANQRGMLFPALATACGGIFCGAAIYNNLVEHPARVSCGPELAVRELG